MNKNTAYKNANVLLNDVLVQHIEYLFTLAQDDALPKEAQTKIIKSLIILNAGLSEFQKQILSTLINTDMSYPKH